MAPPVSPDRRLGSVFLAGAIGTGAELVLLEHLESPWQGTPVVLLALGIVEAAVLLIQPAPRVRAMFNATMWLFILSGVAGAALHYEANHAFEVEVNPDAQGWPLVWESLKGAVPSLAPGTMALLGAIGLATTPLYEAGRREWRRHPASHEDRPSGGDTASSG